MNCPVTKIKGGEIIGFFEEPKEEPTAKKRGRPAKAETAEAEPTEAAED